MSRGGHIYGLCDGCGESAQKMTLRGGEWHCDLCAVDLVFIHVRRMPDGNDIFELEADCPLERECWSPVPWRVAEGLC